MNAERVMTGGAPAWHALSPEALAGELRTNLRMGLPESEAGRRLADLGLNELPEAPPVSPLRLLLAQFESLIIWVLIGAAVISGLLADWVDTAAILAIVVLNAALGFIQEYRAERVPGRVEKAFNDDRACDPRWGRPFDPRAGAGSGRSDSSRSRGSCPG